MIPPNLVPHKSGTVASAWFGGRSAGISDDIVLIESAIRLRNSGVLTLLTPLTELNPQRRYEQTSSSRRRRIQNAAGHVDPMIS